MRAAPKRSRARAGRDVGLTEARLLRRKVDGEEGEVGGDVGVAGNVLLVAQTDVAGRDAADRGAKEFEPPGGGHGERCDDEGPRAILSVEPS